MERPEGAQECPDGNGSIHFNYHVRMSERGVAEE